MPFHLYFHLPYCRRKCPYCDFFKVVPRAGERERYVRALLAEISLAAKCYSIFVGPASTVYFGGGTPSLHTPEELSTLVDNARAEWGLCDGAEITLEANPGTLTAETLNGWGKAGINRLSIGGQSFSARKLSLLYRDHSAEEIHEAFRLARAAGFSNMSLDLIFGLPGETLDEWKSDLEAASALHPEHISLYNLEFHEGTPFDRWRHSGRLVPLSEDAEADLYLFTHDFFVQRGYEHYEVSNFAKPGFRSVHNSAYWQGHSYLGLGPSAHSFDGNTLRFFNKPDLHAYFSEIEASRLPVGGQQNLSVRDQIEEWISLRLRRSEGIGFSDAVERLGAATAHKLWERAAKLPVTLTSLNDNHFALTAEGWFRENSVLLFLFEGLEDASTENNRS
jgi:oxygen-independent coproporphyrinogen-3 oxidase